MSSWIKSAGFSLTCDEYIYVSNSYPLKEVEITPLVYWTRQGLSVSSVLNRASTAP